MDLEPQILEYIENQYRKLKKIFINELNEYIKQNPLWFKQELEIKDAE